MEENETMHIQDLIAVIMEMKADLNRLIIPNFEAQSKNLNELYTALALAQKDYNIAELNRKNPYYERKYADLCSLMEATRPSLAQNGLSIIQQILSTKDGESVLHTRLCHSSGQWIESQIKIIPPKNDIDSLSSHLEKLKRNSYAALVGIVAQTDDDDGEVAMIDARQAFAKGPSNKYNPKQQSYKTITKEQLEEIEYELGDFMDIAEEIMDGYRIQSLADLPSSKFRTAITRIREIIATREGTA